MRKKLKAEGHSLKPQGLLLKDVSPLLKSRSDSTSITGRSTIAGTDFSDLNFLLLKKSTTMGIENDEFGRNPSVQRMRKIFSGMEKFQWDMLEKLKISHFDDRLQNIRKNALDLFGKSFPLAASKGMTMDEKTVSMLYAFCLAQAIKLVDIDVPGSILPDNKTLEEAVTEALS